MAPSTMRVAMEKLFHPGKDSASTSASSLLALDCDQKIDPSKFPLRDNLCAHQEFDPTVPRSRYRGVTYHQGLKKWQAIGSLHTKYHKGEYLGLFKTEIAAAEARYRYHLALKARTGVDFNNREKPWKSGAKGSVWKGLEEAPPGSKAHTEVKRVARQGYTGWEKFEFTFPRNGEMIEYGVSRHLCSESQGAARIARLCYAKLEAGASVEDMYAYGENLIAMVRTHDEENGLVRGPYRKATLVRRPAPRALEDAQETATHAQDGCCEMDAPVDAKPSDVEPIPKKSVVDILFERAPFCEDSTPERFPEGSSQVDRNSEQSHHAEAGAAAKPATPGANLEANVEASPEIDRGANPNAISDAPESTLELKLAAKPEPKPEVEPDAKRKTSGQVGPETKLEEAAESGVGIKRETAGGTDTEAKPSEPAEVFMDARPEVTMGSQVATPEAKLQANVEAVPDTKPKTMAKAKPQTMAKARLEAAGKVCLPPVLCNENGVVSDAEDDV